jgi:hypothetical protein
MSTNSRAGSAPKIRELQLNRETLQDLTGREADEAKGGQRPNSVRNTCAGVCHIITGKCYGKKK